AGAAVLGHVVELVAVGAPHRVAVLAVECGQPALRGTIRARQPDVVAGGAAVAPTIPQPRPADERDGVAGRREVSLLRLEQVELPLRAALGRHDVGLHIGRERGRAGGREHDALAVRGPPTDHVLPAVEGQPPGLAADRRDDKHVVTAVAVGAERDRLALVAVGPVWWLGGRAGGQAGG